ncbi:Fur family ferric uptake regulator [Cupriavidus basilensis OR16]|uniref:Fur family ferric uptake regulator n=1 Tax=Cupriavidus basilensis OR16 TaxID=1127483 RepID=H1SF71_9BURK|nr:transcriptional repressor [Cupriavidus basilensis]EHP38827.1 Fur family ferric uptake regulator [Cupriavidus basilensis OR16]
MLKISRRAGTAFAPAGMARVATQGSIWGEAGKAAAQEIAARGLVVSIARIALLLVMRQIPSRHATAEQICREMLQSPYRTPISTFRTAIYEFTDVGLLALVHYYELADRPPHEHLYCTQCQRMEEVRDEPLMALRRARFAAQGLRPANMRTVLIGQCKDCTCHKARQQD